MSPYQRIELINREWEPMALSLKVSLAKRYSSVRDTK